MKKYLWLFIVTLLTQSLHAQFNTRPQYIAPRALISPVIDGNANDSCWMFGEWATLDYDWLLQSYAKSGKNYPKPFDSDDFSGRFKISWDEDYLYVLAEITDDIIYDDNEDPLTDYWKDDCFEVFIDEDASRDYHNDNFSAFAYHMSTVTGDVVDFDTDEQPYLFNDNVEFEISTEGTVHTWEIAIKIYDDTYVRGGDNTPLKLHPGKIMGFSAAYCDDDGGDIDNFVGWVEGGLQSSKYADVFGTLILAENSLIQRINNYQSNGNSYSLSKSNKYSYNGIDSREYAEYLMTEEDTMLTFESYEVLNKDFGDFIPEYINKYEYQDGELFYSSKETYENGLTTKKELTYYNPGGSIAENSIEQTFTYDQDKNLLSIVTEEYISGNYKNMNKYTFEYTSKGKLSSRFYKVWENAAWKTMSVDSVIYSDLYKPIRKSTHTLYNGNMQVVSDEEISYDDYMMPDTIIRNTANGSVKIEYENIKNQTQALTYYEKAGSEWVPYRKDIMDEDLVISRNFKDGESWTPYRKTVQNKKLGYMADEMIYLNNGSEFALVYLDTTQYENGLPVFETRQVNSFSDGSLLNGAEREITYRLASSVLLESEDYKVMPFDEDLFKLYPNPATDRLNISLPDNSEKISIRLFDINGKRIYIQNSNNQSNHISMDVDNLTPGMYFVQIVTGSHLKTLKLIKK